MPVIGSGEPNNPTFSWLLIINVIEKILHLKKHDPAEKDNKIDFLNNSVVICLNM